MKISEIIAVVMFMLATFGASAQDDTIAYSHVDDHVLNLGQQIKSNTTDMNNNFCLSDGTMLRGGTYRIERFFGASRYECTYEASVDGDSRRVVVKEFFPGSCSERDGKGCVSALPCCKAKYYDARDAFVSGAKLQSDLRLSGLVDVVDIFEENGTSYYVLDQINGRSLSDEISLNGPMTEPIALNVIRLLGETVESLHRNDWLHLDLNTDNIWLNSDGRPVIISLGTSKRVELVIGEGANGAGGYVNFNDFSAYEITFNDMTKISKNADVYSLGAILCAMLVGKNPPRSVDIIYGDIELELPSNISEATVKAIKQAMEPSRKKRTASVAEFLAMLPGNSD